MRKIRTSDLEGSRPRLQKAIAKQVEIVARYKAHGSADAQFRKLYAGFFRVRRNAAWREEYFKLFEKYAAANDGLFLLLWDLFKATGNVEASFASKMLAMIDPDRPIWDLYVLKNLGIKPPPPYLDPGVRIGMVCEKMETISKAYDRLAAREDMVAAIEWIDANFPLARQLSNMKKMDFVLWSIRK